MQTEAGTHLLPQRDSHPIECRSTQNRGFQVFIQRIVSRRGTTCMARFSFVSSICRLEDLLVQNTRRADLDQRHRRLTLGPQLNSFIERFALLNNCFVRVSSGEIEQLIDGPLEQAEDFGQLSLFCLDSLEPGYSPSCSIASPMKSISIQLLSTDH